MAQDNTVVIDFIGNTDQLQKSLQDVDKQVIKTGKDYETAFAEVNKANQQAEQGTKQLAGNLQDLNKTVANGAIKEYSKDLQGAVEKLYDQGKVTEALITKYGTATGALKAMQKELATMAALGQSGTKQFKELAKATAELQDTIGDTRGEIKKLASDTRVFDTLVQGARGMAAGFSLVTGTMAALGSENENVQKTLLKVQGAMAALQGVQELANIATEKGGIVTQAYGLALTAVEFIEKRFAVTSAAAWAAATGGVAILVAAVGGLIYWLSSASDAQEKLNDDLKEYDKLSETINEKQRENRKLETENYYKEKIANSKNDREAIKLQIELEEKLVQSVKEKIKFQKQATEAALAGGGENNPYYVELKNALDKSIAEELGYEEKIKSLRDKLAKDDEDREKKSLDNYIKSLRERQKADEAYILAQLNAYDEADEKLRAALKEAGDNTDLTKEQRIQYYFLAGMDNDEIAQRLSSILSKAEEDAATVLNSRIKNSQFNRAYFEGIWKESRDNQDKEDLDKAKKIGKELINQAKFVTDTIFAYESEQRQIELDNQLKAIDKAKQQELANINLTEGQKSAIEEKYRRQEAAAKAKAWKAEQESKAEQAVMNGLLALTTSLAQQGYPAGLVTGLLALAQAGVQAGLILSKPVPAFAKGTEYVEQGNAPSGVDTIHARLNIGERVVPTEINKQLAGIKNEDLPKLLQAAYYPPIPHAPEMSGLNAVVVQQNIDYKKLGKVIAEELRANPQTHINIDKGGFSLHVIEKGKKVQSLNSRYES